jgi:alpha-tubulin suppressor-like RCC1 family protein
MTTPSSFIAKQLAAALVFATLAIACSQSRPQIDSSTHWLHACESNAECGELSCVCGTCNVSCNSNSACDGLDSDAECSMDQPLDSSCGGEVPVCVLRCSADSDCAAGLTCQDELCADPAAGMASIDAGSNAEGDRSVEVDAGRGADYGFGFTQIAVGGRHTCGLVGDGSMLCWGSNYYGELEGAEAGAGFVQITGGGVHGCGLRDDGSLFCWGGGDLDRGQVTGPNADASTDFTQVVAGFTHTCALRNDGSATCWGEDAFGQVSGPNDSVGQTFTQLTGGYDHTCALRSDGTLSCWGRDLYGEVSGPNSDASTNFTQIAAGAHHTCALRSDGGLSCWGTGEWVDEVTGPNADTRRDFVQVMAAAYQTCGLHSDTTITCWGDDSDDQVTGANTKRVAGFAQLSGSIEVDGNHLCALAGDGTVSCWGNDNHDQLSGLDALALQPR